jgi:hypothetical protein
MLAVPVIQASMTSRFGPSWTPLADGSRRRRSPPRYSTDCHHLARSACRPCGRLRTVFGRSCETIGGTAMCVPWSSRERRRKGGSGSVLPSQWHARSLGACSQRIRSSRITASPAPSTRPPHQPATRPLHRLGDVGEVGKLGEWWKGEIVSRPVLGGLHHRYGRKMEEWSFCYGQAFTDPESSGVLRDAHRYSLHRAIEFGAAHRAASRQTRP